MTIESSVTYLKQTLFIQHYTPPPTAHYVGEYFCYLKYLVCSETNGTFSAGTKTKLSIYLSGTYIHDTTAVDLPQIAKIEFFLQFSDLVKISSLYL